jgi:hypothetical protein
MLFAAVHESVVGTCRTSGDVRHESAMRSKADIRQRNRFSEFMPSKMAVLPDPPGNRHHCCEPGGGSGFKQEALKSVGRDRPK